MADENSQDLNFGEPDAGAGFRVEMALTNFFLGYWKHLASVAAVVLVSVLVYGWYSDGYIADQTVRTDVSAEVLNTLADTELFQGKLLPGQRGSLTIEQQIPRMAPARVQSILLEPAASDSTEGVALTEAADKLEANALASTGIAAQEAWLYAAELHRLAGNADARIQALQAASDHGGEVGLFAESALAGAELDSDDDALRQAGKDRLRRLSTADDGGFVAQKAALDLATVLHSENDDAGARQQLSVFATRWPASSLNDAVERLSSMLGDEAAPPTDEAAPSEDEATPSEDEATPPADEAPADDATPEEG